MANATALANKRRLVARMKPAPLWFQGCASPAITVQVAVLRKAWPGRSIWSTAGSPEPTVDQSSRPSRVRGRQCRCRRRRRVHRSDYDTTGRALVRRHVPDSHADEQQANDDTQCESEFNGMESTQTLADAPMIWDWHNSAPLNRCYGFDQ